VLFQYIFAQFIFLKLAVAPEWC